MSITDELRAWAKEHLSRSSILAIADRIDAEHQKALDEWKAKHGQMWLKGYAECHAELLEGNETLASDLERCGWIRLPKDADGEYVHIGDVMAYEDNTKPMVVVALVPPAVFLTEYGPRFADMCRHHHAPTVEDVLTEFGIDWEHESDCEDRAALLKEYASKLRLAEGEGA